MKINKNKRYFSIKTKITVWFVLFILIIMALVFSFFYINVKKIYRDDISDRLLNMVSIASLQVDGDAHSLLKVRADQENQAYKDIKKNLQDIRDNSTDITYIYTLRKNENNEIIFIVDAEENEEDVSNLGDVYDEASLLLKDNITKPVVEKDFTTDKWGTWLSGYAPFYTKDGKIEGILGIDIPASEIIENENKIFFEYLLYYILSGIIATVLGIFLSKKLTEPIVSLTELLKKNNNKTEPIIGIADEVEDLSNALKVKLGNLDFTEKDLLKKMQEKTETLERMNRLMVGRELEMVKLKKEILELKNEK